MKTRSPASPRRNSAQWAKLVEQSETTTLTLRAFCMEAGVPLPSLYYWRNKIRAAAQQEQRGFTELKPAPKSALAAAPLPPTTEGTIEVTLANGRTVRVTGGPVDAQALRTVIQVAEGGAPC